MTSADPHVRSRATLDLRVADFNPFHPQHVPVRVHTLNMPPLRISGHTVWYVQRGCILHQEPRQLRVILPASDSEITKGVGEGLVRAQIAAAAIVRVDSVHQSVQPRGLIWLAFRGLPLSARDAVVRRVEGVSWDGDVG